MISPAHMILRALWVMAANYQRPLAKSMRSTVSSSGFSSLDRLHYSCFCNSIQAFLLYLLKEPDRALLSGLLPLFPVPALAASRQRTVVLCAMCRLPLYSVQGFIVQWGIEPRAAPPRYHMTSPQQGRSVLRSPMMRLPLYSFYPPTAALWSSWPLGWRRPLDGAGRTSGPPASGSPVQIWCLKS